MTMTKTIQSVNPATEEVLAEYSEMSDAEIERALAQAQAAHEKWRETSFAERRARVNEMAKYLRANKTEMAKLITLEMGKPIPQAEAEVEKCAFGAEWYA